jgi:hypothetical protein
MFGIQPPGERTCSSKSVPNSYEASFCQEPNYSSEQAFAFVRFAGPGAVCSQLRVLT